jgi:hypothetical protein
MDNLNEIMETLSRWKNEADTDVSISREQAIATDSSWHRGFSNGKAYAYDRMLALLKINLVPA